MQLARKEALRYQIARDDGKTLLQLRERPLLKWSNPSEGALYGSVLLWTVDGRPETIASIYRWYGDKMEFHAEFKSLSPYSLKAEREKKTVWDAQPSDIKFDDLAGAPAPADTEAGRLRQMRDLARRFSAQLDHPRKGSNALRLLPQPIFRYEKTPQDAIDGALFSFVQATDPELRSSSRPKKHQTALAGATPPPA